MNQLILKQMGLPDEEDTILGTQLNCNDKAIEYAVTGLLNNDHQLEEEFGKYAGRQSVVWLTARLTQMLSEQIPTLQAELYAAKKRD